MSACRATSHSATGTCLSTLTAGTTCATSIFRTPDGRTTPQGIGLAWACGWTARSRGCTTRGAWRCCYVPETLATQVTLTHPNGDLSIACTDVVDFHEYALVRKFTVTNTAQKPREVRIFFHHDFHISETDVGDTAYYDPSRGALVHYKGSRWFLMDGFAEGSDVGFSQWAVGKKETEGKEGTWRDAEDGQLSGNSIVQGSVDSVGAIHARAGGGARQRQSGTGWRAAFPITDVARSTPLSRTRRPRCCRPARRRTGGSGSTRSRTASTSSARTWRACSGGACSRSARRWTTTAASSRRRTTTSRRSRRTRMRTCGRATGRW